MLRDLSEALRSSNIPFMLTGSVAAAYYGAARATMGINVVVDPTPEQLLDFVQRVGRGGAYVSLEPAREALAARTMFNVVDPESGWKADLIIRRGGSTLPRGLGCTAGSHSTVAKCQRFRALNRRKATGRVRVHQFARPGRQRHRWRVSSRRDA